MKRMKLSRSLTNKAQEKLLMKLAQLPNEVVHLMLALINGEVEEQPGEQDP